jgi:hypothetical protein
MSRDPTDEGGYVKHISAAVSALAPPPTVPVLWTGSFVLAAVADGGLTDTARLARPAGE